MSMETHYVCAVCAKVAVVQHRGSDHKGSDDITGWFTVTLSANQMSSMRTEKRTYEMDHVCSIECMEEFCDRLKEIALRKARGSDD